MHWWVSLLVGVALSSAAAAHAEPPSSEPSPPSSEADAARRAVARELGLEGIRLYKEGQHASALDKLTRAHELVGLTTTGLWRARCLVALGRLVEASEALFVVARMALPADAKPVHVDAQRKAEQERKAVLARVPRLLIRIDGEIPDDTVVLLDGHVVPPALIGIKQPLDPGQHVLEARGAGTSEETIIVLAEGQVLEVPIRLVDRDGAPHRARFGALHGHDDEPAPILWTLGWVATGVGAAGLLAGAITGGLALGERDHLDERCPNRACGPAFHGDVDAFESLRLASTVALIAGGAVTLAGVSMVIVGAVSDADAETDTATRLSLTPSGLWVRGRF